MSSPVSGIAQDFKEDLDRERWLSRFMAAMLFGAVLAGVICAVQLGEERARRIALEEMLVPKGLACTTSCFQAATVEYP